MNKTHNKLQKINWIDLNLGKDDCEHDDHDKMEKHVNDHIKQTSFLQFQVASLRYNKLVSECLTRHINLYYDEKNFSFRILCYDNKGCEVSAIKKIRVMKYSSNIEQDNDENWDLVQEFKSEKDFFVDLKDVFAKNSEDSNFSMGDNKFV